MARRQDEMEKRQGRQKTLKKLETKDNMAEEVSERNQRRHWRTEGRNKPGNYPKRNKPRTHK